MLPLELHQTLRIKISRGGPKALIFNPKSLLWFTGSSQSDLLQFQARLGRLTHDSVPKRPIPFQKPPSTGYYVFNVGFPGRG